MIKALVIEDQQNKIKDIRNVLEISFSNIDIATDCFDARKKLAQNKYDILLLDICIPEKFGDEPSPATGMSLLQEIKRSSRLQKPTHIIGITAFELFQYEFDDELYENLLTLLHYDPANNNWESILKDKINEITNEISQRNHNIDYDYDLAIITALRDPELKAILELDGKWRSHTVAGDQFEYFVGSFDNEKKHMKVVAAAALHMGMSGAVVLATKLISNFKPRRIVMAGIAAGAIENAGLGDILAAELSFDYGSGKITYSESMDSHFEPDYKPISISSEYVSELQSSSKEKYILDSIKNGWVSESPNTSLSLHIGPLGSGAGVIKNSRIIRDIKSHARKLIGIDMETYGVYYAAKNCSKPRPQEILSIKSISDFGDSNKNDRFQNYASYTSARFLYYFFMERDRT